MISVVDTIIKNQQNILILENKLGIEIVINDIRPRAIIIDNCQNCAIYFINNIPPITLTILGSKNIKVGLRVGPLSCCTLLRCTNIDIEWVTAINSAKSFEIVYCENISIIARNLSEYIIFFCDSSLNIFFGTRLCARVNIYNSFFMKPENFIIAINSEEKKNSISKILLQK